MRNEGRRTGVITYNIEVPVEFGYAWYPEVRMTRDDPGYPAHIEIDFAKYPTDEDWGKLIDKHADRIREACFEDLDREPILPELGKEE